MAEGWTKALKSDLVEVYTETAEKALAHYRRVRDEIKDIILSLPQSLNNRKGK